MRIFYLFTTIWIGILQRASSAMRQAVRSTVAFGVHGFAFVLLFGSKYVPDVALVTVLGCFVVFGIAFAGAFVLDRISSPRKDQSRVL